MRKLRWYPIIFFIVALTSAQITGCAGQQKLKGENVLSAFQEVVNMIGKRVSPSVVYVEVIRATETRFGPSTRSVSMAGIVLDPDGQILLPTCLIDKNIEIREISVWVNDEEYKASLVQTDKRLNISIVKTRDKVKLTPAIWGDATTIKIGEWLIGVSSSGREYNYQKFLGVGMVNGKFEAGEVDQIFISGLGRGPVRNEGMPLVNLKGEVVGWVQRSRVVAINEVKRKVDKLLAKAALGEEEKPGEAEPKKEPWLGIAYGLLNDEYAEAMNLPKESILVRYVIGGGPVAKSGLKPHDLIIAVDDQPITKKGPAALREFRKLLDPELNREITFKVLTRLSARQEGKETKTIKCKFEGKPEPKVFKAEDLGISVQNVTDMEYYEKDLAVKEGVLVTKLERGSPATTSELFGRPLIYSNDVIIELHKLPTRTIDEFRRAVDVIRREKPESVLVKFWRGNYITHAALNLKIGEKKKETTD